jgi:hypothetical protein
MEEKMVVELGWCGYDAAAVRALLPHRVEGYCRRW